MFAKIKLFSLGCGYILLIASYWFYHILRVTVALVCIGSIRPFLEYSNQDFHLTIE